MALRCTRLIHPHFTFSNSSAVNGPVSFLGVLQLAMNLVTHAATHRAYFSSCFSNTSSILSLACSGCANHSTSRIVLTSTSVVGQAEVTGLGGHSSQLASHLGLFHQSVDPFTDPPRLAKTAGFSLELTCHHITSDCALIFIALFWTNCLNSQLPHIQCRAMVLSSQPYTLDIGSPSKAFLTLVSKLVAIWPATSSKWGMESPPLQDVL